MLRVCQQLASTVQYHERSILLLVTSASDLPIYTIKRCKSCDTQDPLMRGGLRDKQIR